MNSLRTLARVAAVSILFAAVAPVSAQVINLYNTVTTGISAAGTTQGTATALTTSSNIVSTTAAGTGVVLPVPTTAMLGLPYYVRNSGANILKVYPNTSVQINALGANVAMQVAVGTMVQVVCSTTTQCHTQP